MWSGYYQEHLLGLAVVFDLHKPRWVSGEIVCNEYEKVIHGHDASFLGQVWNATICNISSQLYSKARITACDQDDNQ